MDEWQKPRVGQPLQRRQFAMDFKPANRVVPRPSVQAAATASVKHIVLPVANSSPKQRVPRLLRHVGLLAAPVLQWLLSNKYIRHYIQLPLEKVANHSHKARKWFMCTRVWKLAQNWGVRAWGFAKLIIRPIIKNPVTRFIKGLPPIYKGVALGIIAAGIVAGGYVYIHNQQYVLSKSETQLLARSSVDTKLIKTTKDGFSYNRTTEQHKDGFDAVLAASKADTTGKFPYQVNLPKNQSKGITFASSDGSLSFTMTPLFTTAAGREEGGRVLYPEGLNSIHSYTFKRNGVKQDIVLSKAPGSDTYTKSWKLNLGDKLEAHMLPSGAVGIYSASQMLSGNVTASNPADQKLLDAARKNGQKDNLEFVIPAPYVTYATGAPQYSGAKYTLKNNVLTLIVKDMKSRAYPLSIDPSTVVTTTADFQQGTDDDGMIDYSTSGQINRADISYGTPSSFNQQTSAFTTTRYDHTSVVYNGYLYIIGGYNGSYMNDIQYCPLNANGSVGACTTNATGFTTGRYGHTSVVYNGYLYIIGGYDGSTYYNDIQYCLLNANGSVGTCTQQTNAFTTGRQNHTSVVYNGNLYIIGGYNGSYMNDIQYCPFNGNGSVGACTQQTNAFTTARYAHTSVVYNGYLYIIGGYSGSFQNDIQYCPLNANGSVGTCTQQTNAFTTARLGQTAVAYNGYLYIIGGYDGTTYRNDIQYCPFNGNGSVGTCTQQTNAFTTGRQGPTSVVYNGYLYIVGGYNGSGVYLNDIQYGLLGKYASTAVSTQQTSAFTNARNGQASIVYNGYLYIVGGQNSGTYYSDIQYCPINASGSVGTCTTNATGFTTARSGLAAVAYNGYLYITGGVTSASATNCTTGSGSAWYCNDIQYCPLNINGTVGSCTVNASGFTTARYQHTAAVYNGYLYITGGFTPGQYLGDIQYCQIQINGTVAGCTTNSTGLGVLRKLLSSVVYEGYLYVIGGYDGSYHNDILYCSISSTGSVGACTDQTNAFTSARGGHTSIVYNGYLYIVGGQGAASATGCDASGFCNDTQFCPINTNASVGSCTQELNAFTSTRNQHSSVVFNGYLYIIGGSNSLYFNDIQYLPIVGGNIGVLGTGTQQTSAFTTARYGQASVVYNGYLYVIGGFDGTNYLSDIQYCPLNTNGSVGTCTANATGITTVRRGLAAVASNGYLYIVGGQTNNSATSCTTGSGANWYCNDIQYCPFTASGNGTVGACTQQANAFTTARGWHASVVYNGYLYITGGVTSSSATGCTSTNFYCGDVQYCPINTNGTVGACTQQATALVASRGFLASVVYNNYLYVIGGSGGPGTDVQYCPFNSNGSVGTCTQQFGVFLVGRNGIGADAYNGHLYVMAGNPVGATYLNDIQTCQLNSNGSVGDCGLTASFTGPRWSPTSVLNNGYVYVVGGTTGSSVTGCTAGGGSSWYCNDIQYFKITDRNFGTSGSTTQQTSAFTTARAYHTSVVYNGYLYIVGGYNGSYFNDIQYCPLNSNGSVGTCTQQTNAFTSARYNHTSVVYNGYLYIIGGNAPGGSTGCNISGFCGDIQYCPLNSNGSVGTCTQQLNAFTTPREYHTSVVYNGYLYIIGGNSGSFLNDIQYCPLNSNGSVGTCTDQLNAFTTPRYYHTSVVYNGYLYIIGGYSGSYLNDIQYCPLNSNGSAGTCIDQLNAFTTARNIHTSVAANGYLYIIGGAYNGAATLGDIQHCSISSNGSVGTCVQQTSAFTNPRYGHASVVANGYLYVIGGFASVSSTGCTGTSNSCNDIQYIPFTNPNQGSNYEKVIDFGSVADKATNFVVNGLAGCGIRIDYQLAGSNGIFGSTTTILGATVGTTYAINQTNVRYVHFKVFMDDGTCGGKSDITDITINYSFAPSAPTLIAPSNGVVGTSFTPLFQLRSSDATGTDWARYKIFVCSDSLCSTVIRTIDQTASQTGWSGQDSQAGTAYVTNSVLTSSTIANHTYQAPALSAGTQYWWEAQAIDPGDTNIWGPLSSISTFTTNSTPAAPTLSAPAAGATGVAAQPVFQLRTTDADSDYLRYKILVCSTSNCSSVVRTIDQTASQTGWSGQDQQTSTAYTGNPVITSSTMATHTYQAPALSFGTQYWWEAFAIDPGGSNTFSSASAIQTFTTTSPPNAPTLITPLTTGTSIFPLFQMTTTDIDGDYVKYKIDVCTTSNCSSILRTVDQTSSQTGWQDQDQQSATAYSSGRTARYQWQPNNLAPNTQYWWRAAAIDPAGTNTFGSYSSIGTFTTAQTQSTVRGGSIIRGGTIVK